MTASASPGTLLVAGEEALGAPRDVVGDRRQARRVDQHDVAAAASTATRRRGTGSSSARSTVEVDLQGPLGAAEAQLDRRSLERRRGHPVDVAVAVPRDDAGALAGVGRRDLLADERVQQRRLAGLDLAGDGDAQRAVEARRAARGCGPRTAHAAPARPRRAAGGRTSSASPTVLTTPSLRRRRGGRPSSAAGARWPPRPRGRRSARLIPAACLARAASAAWIACCSVRSSSSGRSTKWSRISRCVLRMVSRECFCTMKQISSR